MAHMEFMRYQSQVLQYCAEHDGIDVLEAIDRYAKYIRRHVNRRRGGVYFNK